MTYLDDSIIQPAYDTIDCLNFKWYFKDNMSMYEGYSLIYPPNYNELAAKHADAARLSTQDNMLSSELADKIARPADATARGLGDIAIQSITGGILHPTFDIQKHEIAHATSTQTLALGNVSLRDYMLRGTTSHTATEATILGYADRQTA